MEEDLQPNISFLSLLMAPDNTPEDHTNREINQNFINFLHTPPYYSDDYPNNNTYDHINNYNNQIVPYYPDNPPFFLQPRLALPPPPSLPPPEFFYHTLPDLLCVDEKFAEPRELPAPPSLLSKPPVNDDYSLDSILKNYMKNSSKKKKKAENKRSKMGEKVYNLGKLLPGVQMKRKNTVEVLEEAHKYVKFLEAQVKALRSMPTESEFTDFNGGRGGGGGGGALVKLNRQQVLEVVVNSAAAQMVMAENGWCLVSAEQVALMKRVEARQKIIQQVLDTIPF